MPSSGVGGTGYTYIRADGSSTYRRTALRQAISFWSLPPITIDVPPWFSADNVSHVYKSLKKDSRTKPQPSPRRLALFEFVMKQPEVTVPGE